jgi:glycosyltransferase involved in cell wall biosynthesis
MSELVSVVIPTYQRGKFFLEAVESVLAQTYSDIEIIVVEDGSHEAEQKLDLLGSPVRYIWQPNQGVAAARNTGVREAKGGWIAFLDDDDLWLPEKLSRQMSLIRDHSDLGLVHTHHFIRNGEKQWVDSRVYLPPDAVPSGFVTHELVLHNFIVTSSALVKRDLVTLAGGFRTEFQPAEDYDLWLRLSLLAPFGFVQEPLAIYRDHDSALTTDSTRARSATIATLRAFFKNSPDLYTDRERGLVKKRVSALHLSCAKEHLLCRRYSEARRYFWGAWVSDRTALSSLVYASFLLLPGASLGLVFGLARMLRQYAVSFYKTVRRVLGFRISNSGAAEG